MTALLGLRDTDIAKIVEILHNHAEVDKGIIFGSRAKGNYKSGSDVDIALKGKALSLSSVSKISSRLMREPICPIHSMYLITTLLKTKVC